MKHSLNSSTVRHRTGAVHSRGTYFKPTTRGKISPHRASRWRRTTKHPLSVLVIPCHNEALRLNVGRIHALLEREPDWHFLFVDDGSTDGTALMLAELSRAFREQVLVLTLPQNAGKAEAVRQGLLHALDQQPVPTYVGYLDADFSTPPESLEPFRDLLQRRKDLQGVIGVRLELGGRHIKRELHKSVMNKTLAWLSSAVLGVRFRDPTCGAKLLRASPELRSALHRPFLSRGIFDVELISRLGMYFDRSGLGPLEWSLYEYPLEQWNDVGGSHRKLDDYFDALWDLGKIFWENTWYGFSNRQRARERESDLLGDVNLARIQEPAPVDEEPEIILPPDDGTLYGMGREREEALLEETLRETAGIPEDKDGDGLLSSDEFDDALAELDESHADSTVDAFIDSTEDLDTEILGADAMAEDWTEGDAGSSSAEDETPNYGQRRNKKKKRRR
jgi:glycosyltransferase involved in cell wall biosynthesis